ncbi:hypothetical protein A2U01_0108070, partial [Trifolium medium]|nr:hypothetical protein [Trifolium medium]
KRDMRVREDDDSVGERDNRDDLHNHLCRGLDCGFLLSLVSISNRDQDLDDGDADGVDDDGISGVDAGGGSP